MRRFKVNNGNNDKSNLISDNHSSIKVAFGSGSQPKLPKPPKVPYIDLGTGSRQHPKLPENISANYENALKVIKGKWQLDEIKNLKNTGVSAAVGFVANNFQKLLSSNNVALPYIIKSVVLGEILAFVFLAAKSKIRSALTKRSHQYLDNLKNIENKKYVIKSFSIGSDLSGKEKLTPAGDLSWTLKEIANSAKGGTIFDDHWRSNNLLFAFADQKDVNDLDYTFRTILDDDARDAFKSNIAPYAGPPLAAGLIAAYDAYRDLDRASTGKNPVTNKPYTGIPASAKDKAKAEKAIADLEGPGNAMQPTKKGNR